jgi:DnaJ-class molecular chaperone
MTESPADNYWPEPCANCQGRGKLEINFDSLSNGVREFALRYQLEPDCPVCSGKAFVLVLQPAQHCRTCAGMSKVRQSRCFDCLGTGWMFVLKERAENSR